MKVKEKRREERKYHATLSYLNAKKLFFAYLFSRFYMNDEETSFHPQMICV